MFMKESISTRVVGKDGLQGKIEIIAQTTDDESPRALIRLEHGQTILVPTEALVLQEDGSYYLPLTQADIERQFRIYSTSTNEELVIPVVAEELDVEKRTVVTGRIRLTKTVREREEVIVEPLFQDEVNVERLVVNRVLDAPVGVSYEGETMIIPLMEEVLVVEKRLLLREEIRITKRHIETQATQQVTLRSEEIAIERQEP